MSLWSQAPEIFAAWLAWFAAHSLFAADRTKKALAPLVRGRRYRLLYVMVSCVSLAGLLAWETAALPLSEARYPVWQVFRAACLAYAVFMFAAASRAYDNRVFLGLAEEREGELQTGGILGRVRHPWYSGGLAVAAGLGQTPLDRWDFRLLLAAYLVAGCLIEDRRLARRFGKGFTEYRRRVPMLVPMFRKDSPAPS